MVFKGSLNSGRVENHSFTTKDKLLVALGFGCFSKNNCYAIYQKTLPALMVAFPGIYNNSSLPPFPEGGTFLQLGSGVTGYYWYFNKVTKKYDTKRTLSLAYIYELIEYHERRQQGRIPPSLTYDYSIRDIQNSQSGSVRINFALSNIIPLQPGTALVELFFQKKVNRDSTRKMTSIGPPMFTGGPRTPAGTSYAGPGSRNHQASSSSNTGSYLPQAEGGAKNPYNSTTAPLKLHYNSTEKVFEAGTTQTLAKLLTDLPGADVNSSAPTPGSTVSQNSEFYDPKGRYYSGNFTTGIGMPMSIENGNPHMFGPNIVECQNKKVEKVRVVNRSPKSFSAGDIVMLNNMNGEWVASSLGEATTKPKAATVENWAFSKMIVNSDAFFKDSRYLDAENYEDYASSVKASEYEELSRSIFYFGNEGVRNPYKTYLESMKLIQDVFGPDDLAIQIAYLNYDVRKTVNGKSNPNFVGNLDRPSFSPTNKYIVTTAFDIMHKQHGGFTKDTISKSTSAGKIINKINAFDETFDDFTMQSEVFPFWGPVFTEGYRAISNAQRSQLYNNNDALYFTRFIDTGEVDDNGNKVLEPPDIEQFASDKKNVPAEITSRIIDITNLPNLLTYLGGPSSNQARNNILYPPYYFSAPVSTKHVQFIPLTDTLVGHTDILTTELTKWTQLRNFYNQTYGPNGLITGMSTEGGEDGFDHLHGNILKRNEAIQSYLKYDFSAENLSNTRPKTACLTSNYGLPNMVLFDKFPEILIPYDCYVQRPLTKPGLGAPRYFRDTGDFLGANCVGITAGMCTISKPGGGDIDFEIKQHLGVVAQLTDVTSTQSLLGVIGGIFFGGGTSGGVSYDLPQWGSNDDAIDSFGTSALHIRIFDEWADADTLFDPRYFAILHFNPLPDPLSEQSLNYRPNFGSLARYDTAGLGYEALLETYGNNYNQLYLQADGFDPPKDAFGNITVKYISYDERPRAVDKVESSVDFRVPTLDTAVNTDPRTLGSIDWEDRGIVLKPGTLIDKNTGLRPESEWRVNTIRRGQFLTGGGFTYIKSVIGLDPSSGVFVNRGKGFNVNSEIDCGNGVHILVLTTTPEGGIVEFEFSKETEIPYYKNAGLRVNSFGEGFLASDFKSAETQLERSEIVDGERVPTRCYPLTVPSPTEGSDAAVIEFTRGQVWSKPMYDPAPKEHVPLTKLSVGSQKGQIGKSSDLTKQTNVTLGLEANDGGDYRLFTFFHNDITHTPGTGRTFVPGFLQYIDLNIV